MDTPTSQHGLTSFEAAPQASGPFDPATSVRPAPVLLTYYILISLCTVLGFPFVFLVHLFKYETLRYRFDDDGVMMSWGLLFRRETNLTYRRIQDIHVTRNILERWMGLATVSIQTASGSATPEMQIQGIPDASGLRDYLYMKMRGAKGESAGGEAAGFADNAPGQPDEALELLREIRDLIAERKGTP